MLSRYTPLLYILDTLAKCSKRAYEPYRMTCQAWWRMFKERPSTVVTTQRRCT